MIGCGREAPLCRRRTEPNSLHSGEDKAWTDLAGRASSPNPTSLCSRGPWDLHRCETADSAQRRSTRSVHAACNAIAPVLRRAKSGRTPVPGEEEAPESKDVSGAAEEARRSCSSSIGGASAAELWCPGRPRRARLRRPCSRSCSRAAWSSASCTSRGGAGTDGAAVLGPGSEVAAG